MSIFIFDDFKNVLSEEDFIKLLESTSLTIEEKFNLIKLIEIESFEIDENIALLLSNLYFEKKANMSFNLLNIVLEELPKDNKLKTLIFQLEHSNFSGEEITELLNNLSFSYKRLCLRIGSYEIIENTSDNLKLVELLKEKNCISTFGEKGKKIRVNRFGKK